MKSRIEVITLGVNDLEQALAFYRDGLGLPTTGIIGTAFDDGAVVFFDMNDGLILASCSRAALARDATIPVDPPRRSDLAIGHIVKSRKDLSRQRGQATE